MGTKNRNSDFYFILLLIAGTILAFYLRYTWFPYLSHDVRIHRLAWYDYIKQHGFQAFKHSFSTYTPPYLYLLAMAAILPLQKLYAIKCIPVLFDFIAAFFIYKLVKLRYPQSRLSPTLAYLVFLFSPTVVLNGSCWGQSDIVHATFILVSLYYMITACNYKHNLLGIVFFGIACSVKGLGLFLLPAYLIILIKRNISLWNLLLIPVMYIITVIPSWIAGRGFWDLMTMVFSQINRFKALSMKAPNLYIWLPKGWQWLFIPAVVSAGFIVTALIMLSLKYTKKTTFNGNSIIRLSLFFSLVVPFLLPRMHERYFFLADTLSILYAFYFPRYFYLPILITMASSFSYTHFLLRMTLVPASYLTSAILLAIIIVFYDLRRTGSSLQKLSNDIGSNI